MRYLLYEYKKGIKYNGSIDNNYIIKQFKPRPLKLYADWEKGKDFATSIFRMYISILTFGKTRYLCIIDKSTQDIRHSAYVIPKNIKYSFLKKGEYSIGPCNTPKEFRGQGLYPYMLNYITNSDDARYFVFIREDNSASIRGAQKAGFTECKDSVIGTKFLNIFRLQKQKNGV